MRSTVAPSSRKWKGASMCVPVCVPDVHVAQVVAVGGHRGGREDAGLGVAGVDRGRLGQGVRQVDEAGGGCAAARPRQPARQGAFTASRQGAATAFSVCMRFSPWSQKTQYLLSMTSSTMSSPRVPGQAVHVDHVGLGHLDDAHVDLVGREVLEALLLVLGGHGVPGVAVDHVGVAGDLFEVAGVDDLRAAELGPLRRRCASCSALGW